MASKELEEESPRSYGQETRDLKLPQRPGFKEDLSMNCDPGRDMVAIDAISIKSGGGTDLFDNPRD